MMKRSLILMMLCLFPLSLAFGAEDWGPAQFLIGHWTGDGTGQPGQGTGSFSFTPDLQGKVLVRKSFAAYPAANGKPASRHDDLMIVYRDETSWQMRAMYFDSEDHVIPYSVKPADGGGVVFVTEGASNTMRFRLTYSSTGADRLKLKFEIAPPGKDFATYLEGTAHRDPDPK
jgi:hypothetical protein